MPMRIPYLLHLAAPAPLSLPCAARPLTSAPCRAPSCTAARECAPAERRLRAPPSPRLPLSPCPVPRALSPPHRAVRLPALQRVSVPMPSDACVPRPRRACPSLPAPCRAPSHLRPVPCASCLAARECTSAERRLRAPPSPRLPLSPCPVPRALSSPPRAVRLPALQLVSVPPPSDACVPRPRHACPFVPALCRAPSHPRTVPCAFLPCSW